MNIEELTEHQTAIRTYASATKAFQRARRDAVIERLVARLRGRSADLLCYQEVRGMLRARGRKRLGLDTIPLDAIAGSVGRCADYTRRFQPIKNSDQDRWLGAKKAVDAWLRLPPIQVYRVGDVYFVMDGHHRVSVARQSGRAYIEAEVIEVQTRVPLSPDIQPDQLLLRAEQAGFLEGTRLDETRPGTDLSMTEPGHYMVLAAQIEDHRQRIVLEQGREVTYAEAASIWLDTVYTPLVQVIRQRGIMAKFPGRTEADLYAWLCEHHAALERALGWEVDREVALADLVRQSERRSRGVLARARKRILQALAPQRLLR